MTFCPIHENEELRREDNYKTGFCSKCLCHYPLCCETQFMSICTKLLGHDDEHESKNGMRWVVIDGENVVVSYKKHEKKVI